MSRPKGLLGLKMSANRLMSLNGYANVMIGSDDLAQRCLYRGVGVEAGR